jgi:hypothetical protein
MKEKAPKLMILALIVIAVIFAGQGWSMHKQVDIEEPAFHQTQADYLIQAKSIRDGATTGSELNQQLVEIANYPSELMRLKLLGVGNILIGIFFLLLGILMALVMMPKRLAMVIRKNSRG